MSLTPKKKKDRTQQNASHTHFKEAHDVPSGKIK